MSINFPTSPSNGDVHSGFVYDSTLGVWNVISALAVKKFAVTAGSGVYVFSGDGTTADNNPTLYLTRGETYEFDVNASGHPFYINTSNSTGTSNAYSDGVTNNGTASGTIKFVVQMDAPDTLHYNCQYHSSMNAPIYILDRVHSINDLSDVDTTTAAPTDGQALVWDNSASKWEPGTISSGSSYANSDVDTHLNTGTANANEVLSWTGSDYDWVAQASGGGASVSVSDSAPSSPSSGDLWWDSSQAMMFIYYADGSSNQWVKANPSGSGGADIAVQETAPNNPSTGDLWFDPATLKTYVYYNDGNSNQWVQTNPTGGGSGSSDVVDDTTPQLGGNLDVNGNSIVSASNGDIPIAPNGSGKIVLDGLNWPTADGSASQVLKTDGSGQLSFVNNITSVVAGNGLTGGATSGDATVTVGAGAGVTVNSADVAVTMPVQAFVNFDGDVNGSPSISQSGNVSSITDLAVGRYTVNFSTTLPSKPAAVASVNNNSVNTNFGVNVHAVSTTSVNLLTVENGSQVDKNEISMLAVAT